MMKKRSGYQSILAISVSVVRGAGEFVALQRAFFLNRIARFRANLA